MKDGVTLHRGRFDFYHITLLALILRVGLNQWL